jgi:carbonyl reductase 1
VTGGNKGIGLAIVKALAASDPDMHVVLASRSKERGQAALAGLRKVTKGNDERIRITCTFQNVCVKVLDLDDDASVEAFALSLEAEFTAIDVLVNNAGTKYPRDDPTPFAQQAALTMRTNFFQTAKLTDRLLPMLRCSRAGARVINVASQSGIKALGGCSPEVRARLTNPALTRAELFAQSMRAFVDAATDNPGEVDADGGGGGKARVEAAGFAGSCYGMSKLGLVCFTKILARELGGGGTKNRSKDEMNKGELPPGVFVACCCPGYCNTDMSGHRGPRSPEKGAETPVWLASESMHVLDAEKGAKGAAAAGAMFYDCAQIRW